MKIHTNKQKTYMPFIQESWDWIHLYLFTILELAPTTSLSSLTYTLNMYHTTSALGSEFDRKPQHMNMSNSMQTTWNNSPPHTYGQIHNLTCCQHIATRHPQASPFTCGHVGWQCHSAQYSERSILSPYRRVTFLFSAMRWHQGVLSVWVGLSWCPYVLRQLSCDVACAIVLRWKCAVWICALVCRYVKLDTHPHGLCADAVLSCLRGCKAVMTLHHGDLVSSDSRVPAMFPQIVAH
jgi:hypothetical protein